MNQQGFYPNVHMQPSQPVYYPGAPPPQGTPYQIPQGSPYPFPHGASYQPPPSGTPQVIIVQQPAPAKEARFERRGFASFLFFLAIFARFCDTLLILRLITLLNAPYEDLHSHIGKVKLMYPHNLVFYLLKIFEHVAFIAFLFLSATRAQFLHRDRKEINKTVIPILALTLLSGIWMGAVSGTSIAIAILIFDALFYFGVTRGDKNDCLAFFFMPFKKVYY